MAFVNPSKTPCLHGNSPTDTGVHNQSSRPSITRFIVALVIILLSMLITAVPLKARPTNHSVQLNRYEQLGRNLLHSARYNEGKVALVKAAHSSEGIDTLTLRAVDMLYPDFPLTVPRLPDIQYEQKIPHLFRNLGVSRDGDQLIYQRDDHDLIVKNFKKNLIEHIPLDTAFSFTGELIVRDRFIAAPFGPANVGIIDRDDPDGRLNVIDLQSDTGKARRQPPPEIAIDPAGTKIATSFNPMDSPGIRVYRLSDLKQINYFDIPEKVYAMEYSPDGSTLVVSGRHRGNNVFALNGDGNNAQTFDVSRTFAMEFSPDNRLLALGGGRSLTLYDWRNQEEIYSRKLTHHNIVGVQFINDRFLGYATAHGRAGLLDYKKDEVIYRLPIGEDIVYSPGEKIMYLGDKHYPFDLSGLDRFNSSGYDDVPIIQSQHITLRFYTPDTAPAEVEERFQAEGYTSRIRQYRQSKSRQFEIYTNLGGENIFWYPDQERTVYYQSESRRPVDFYVFNNEKKAIKLTKSGNGMAGGLEVFDFTRKERIHKPVWTPPRSLNVSPDENFLIMIDLLNRVHLYSLPTLKKIETLMERTNQKRYAEFSDDGNKLLIQTGQSIRSFPFDKLYRPFASNTRATRIYGFYLEGGQMKTIFKPATLLRPDYKKISYPGDH